MNNALLHAATEEGLLREYCRVMVETGGYRMAWVGFAEDGPGKHVVPVASFATVMAILNRSISAGRFAAR